jgi:hypothetical protein
MQISAASVRVSAHEARIPARCSLAKSTNIPLTHQRPSFVHDGYANALEPLIQYILDPESRAKITSVQLRVCTQLVSQPLTFPPLFV